MTQQTINLGTADQGNGDPLRVAFSKVNANFTELYNQVAAGVVVDTVPPSTPGEGDLWWDPESGRLYVSYDSTWVDASPVDGAGISSTNELVNGAYTVSLGSNGTVTFPDSLTVANSVIGKSSSETISEETIDGTISQTTTVESQIEIDDESIVIVKRATQVTDDTVVVTTDEAGCSITVNNSGVFIKKYAEPDGPNNTSYFQVRTNNGAILEAVEENVADETYGRVIAAQGVVEIATRADGVEKNWGFNYDGTMVVPTNSTILGTNDLTIRTESDGNSGLFLNSSPLVGSAVLYATNNAVITADYDGNRKDWNFDKSGTITVPLLLPKMFTAVLDEAHMVDPVTLSADPWQFGVAFAVNPDGSVETQMDDPTYPVDPGYVQGSLFRFTEADHGIPSYIFDIILFFTYDEEASLFVTNPTGFTPPPTYPATVESLGAIKLNSSGQNWVFGTDGELTVPGAIRKDGGLYMNSSGPTNAASVFVSGNSGDVILRTADNVEQVSYDLILDVNGETSFPGRLNFSDGSTLGDNILTGAIDSDLGLEIKRMVTVSGAHMGPNSPDVLLVDITEDDDITIVQAGWELNTGSEIAPIWLPVETVSRNENVYYLIAVSGVTFETGVTYTFRNPVPESKTWFIRNQTGTLVAPGGAILSSETGDLGGGETYRNFAIELPSPDESSEFRWEFDNSGNLITPGNITVTGGLLTTYGTVVDIAWNTDNYIGLHANPNAGVLVRSSDGDLNYSDWKFEVDGTLEIPGGITTGLVPSVGDVVSGVPTWSGQGGTDNRTVFWFDAASIPQLMTLNNFNGGNLVGWTVSVSDGNSSTITAMHPAGFFSIETAVALTGTGDLTFTSPDYVEAYYKNLDLSIASNIWSFRDDGTLIAPSTIAFGDGNRTNINQVNNNFVITTNTGPGDPYSWTFDDTGNLNLPGGAIIDTYDLGAENATYFWGASNKLLAIRAKESDGSPAGGIHVNADGTVEILAQTSQPSVESVTFTFSPNGGLTFPDTSVQTTAYPGTLAAAKLPYYSDTTARDTAIPSPVNGMTVIVGGSLYFYGNSQWLQLAGTP